MLNFVIPLKGLNTCLKKYLMFEILILGGLMAFCITFYAVPTIIKIANQKKLFDFPEHRKIHKKPIPSLGGVGIFAGLIITILYFFPMKQQHPREENNCYYQNTMRQNQNQVVLISHCSVRHELN